MCGRARCTLNPQQVAQACGLHPQHAAVVPTHHTNRYRPSHNVAPGAHLPVFRLRRSSPSLSPAAEVGPVVECMKWGLVPSFMKKTEKPDHYRMFNARSESIKEKASFRRLLPNNRCLVAVEGFYEWKKDGSKKQPYYIHFKDQRPLVFAALYDSWENSEGEILHTFTILTTRSSSTLEWLHDRMPVILSEASIDVWLNDSSAKSETFLAPYGDPDLVWYPVTPAIGKPSFDGPECIKELKLAGEKPLSMFFAKMTTDKNQPENENQKSSKQEYVEDKVKKEPSTEDALEKLAAEKTKDQNEPEKCGIKREFEKIENTHSNSIPSPLKKKERSMKNTGEKQWSLLSYFGKRISKKYAPTDLPNGSRM